MGHEEDPLRGVRPEFADEVPQLQGVPIRGDVGERLDVHRIRPGFEMGQDPIPGTSMRLGVRNPVAEIHLHVDIGQRLFAVELQRRLPAPAASEEQSDREYGGEGSHHRT